MALSLLARLSYIGLAKEATPGTPVAPTAILPVTTNLSAEDVFAEIKDDSLRNNDSALQGLYQGPGSSDVGFDMLAYPELCGNLLRAIIGPDTITAGTSTTLSAAVTAGATTISTAASIAANQTISIGGTSTEYAVVSAVTGTGPYTLTLKAPTLYAHASAAPVVSQTKHTFAQSNSRIPSYTVTVFDGSSTNPTRAYPGCVMSDLDVKIDPKNGVTMTTKWTGWPSVTATNPSPSFTGEPPMLGWQWTMTNGGASSTRGISLDWSIKRQVEAIHASTGSINPEEVFPGELTLDGTYKARFVDDSDLSLFLTYLQEPVQATLTQPAGGQNPGASLTLGSSQGGIYKGKRNFSQKYLDADFSISGINNSTDVGTLTAVLNNFTTTAY